MRSLGWVEMAEEDLAPGKSSVAVNNCIRQLSYCKNDIRDTVGIWGEVRTKWTSPLLGTSLLHHKTSQRNNSVDKFVHVLCLGFHYLSLALPNIKRFRENVDFFVPNCSGQQMPQRSHFYVTSVLVHTCAMAVLGTHKPNCWNSV